jgi:prophage regulatory protein
MLKPGSTRRRLIRRDELKRRVPYSLTHVWRLEQQGEFPRRITIGENRVAWDEAEVDAWIEARIRAGKDKKIASPRKAAAAAGDR